MNTITLDAFRDELLNLTQDSQPSMLDSFQDELCKIAGWKTEAAEIGGLGVLAAPTIAKMRKKPWSSKNENRAEIGGLGVLAAPSVMTLGKSILKHAGVVKRKNTPMSGVGKVRDSMMQPIVGDAADWASRTNIVSAPSGADAGRVIPTADTMKTAAAQIDIMNSALSLFR